MTSATPLPATAPDYAQDIKTLSAIIGHVSSATTLDIYSHVTDEMQANAANKMEKRFAKNEPFEQSEYETQKQAPPSLESFEPYKGKIRKSGTGGIYELNDHLFEGRYSSTNAYGKRGEVHTVYAAKRERMRAPAERNDSQSPRRDQGGKRKTESRGNRRENNLRFFKISLDFSGIL